MFRPRGYFLPGDVLVFSLWMRQIGEALLLFEFTYPQALEVRGQGRANQRRTVDFLALSRHVRGPAEFCGQDHLYRFHCGVPSTVYSTVQLFAVAGTVGELPLDTSVVSRLAH